MCSDHHFGSHFFGKVLYKSEERVPNSVLEIAPELSFFHCPNNCVPRHSKLSAIRVTAKAICERSGLVLGFLFFSFVGCWSVNSRMSICGSEIRQHALDTHTPTAHPADISRFSCKSPRVGYFRIKTVFDCKIRQNLPMHGSIFFSDGFSRKD